MSVCRKLYKYEYFHPCIEQSFFSLHLLPFTHLKLLPFHVCFYDNVFGSGLLNPLPDDKIADLPKLKSFADDKLNVTENIKVVLDSIENIAGKEENAGYQHFLLFPQCFQKAFSSSASKLVIVWCRVKGEKCRVCK